MELSKKKKNPYHRESGTQAQAQKEFNKLNLQPLDHAIGGYFRNAMNEAKERHRAKERYFNFAPFVSQW